MKVLVTGVKGQLGYDVVNELTKCGIEAVGVDIQEMDITDAASVEKVIGEAAPDAVVHCAAYTAVDAAEDNVEICRKVNADGTQNIANVCKKLDCKMVYINGKNFIKTMLNLGKTHDHLTVVNDQFGSPTYTYDLARLLVDMILTDKYGIYHATNEGICNWYEFACEIFRQAGMKVDVAPVPASEYPTKAKRPENSRMSKAKLTENGFVRLPSWQDALERYLKEFL